MTNKETMCTGKKFVPQKMTSEKCAKCGHQGSMHSDGEHTHTGECYISGLIPPCKCGHKKRHHHKSGRFPYREYCWNYRCSCKKFKPQTKETLSDQRIPLSGPKICGAYPEKNVKEFIKKVKELLVDGDYYGDRSFTDLFKKIDNLAGEELSK